MRKHLLAFVFCLGVANGVTAGTLPAVGSTLVARLEIELANRPEDVETLHQLARALMQQLRTSPDTRVAIRAESVIDLVLKKAPKYAQSWALKAWIQMSRHQFADARASAREAQNLEPGEPLSLGLLTDALVELGQYDEAIASTQTMVDRDPGLPSYSRAAHLRFLHGDTVGAMELMDQAARAGQPQSEELIWVWLQLADLYLQTGQTANAEQIVNRANEVRPDWHPVVAVLAKVRVAQGRLDEALLNYQKTISQQPNPEYVLALWKLAAQLENKSEAKRAARLLNALAALDEKNGGLSRRIFIEFMSHDPKRLTDAERLARKDLESRPDIYSEDALAWVLFCLGKKDEAAQHMARAMRLNTNDATFLQHAAVIGTEKIASFVQEAP